MDKIKNAIINSKLNVLEELLKSKHLITDIMDMTEEIPYLNIYFKEFEAELRYIPTDEDYSFEHFILTLSTEIEEDDIPPLDKRAICNLLNADTKGGVAYVSEDGNRILYRQIMQEVGVPIKEEDFIYAIELFENQFKRLSTVIETFKDIAKTK